jgi:exodeoxyribonuclease VII large subunit
MADADGAATATSNVAEYSVSEISQALKRTVEDAFGRVRVRGEISGYRGPHGSGHAYFRLKDDKAAIEAVIWKGVMGAMRFRPEEGMEVFATGKLTTYPGSSKYQIVIDAMEPAGAGALMALLEERRRKLAAEGLFDPARKQLLPYLPRHIGVITSPTGAVIRDILHRVMDRFPLRVTVWPVRVQGETTGSEVSAALRGFNAMADADRPDLIIVARGGGSLEDLWGFNDEIVVRAVAASDIPVISAVGHETDWTLIDHAADMRAPTPTGAAEMAVPVKAELEATLASLGARLSGAVRRSTDRKRQQLGGLSRALPSADDLLAIPRRKLDETGETLRRTLELQLARKRQRLAAQRLTEASLRSRVALGRNTMQRLGARLSGGLPRLVERARADHDKASRRLDPRLMERLAADLGQKSAAIWLRGAAAFERRLEKARAQHLQAGRLLQSLSHKAVLKRGFALVRDGAGGLVAGAEHASRETRLTIEFADGAVGVRTDGLESGGLESGGVEAGVVAGPVAAAPAIRVRRSGQSTPGGQGDLF